MPGAICDSSTLIHLAKIKRLHLLRDFHKDIFIAPAVWREVVQEGREWPGSSEVEQGRQAGWIEVVEPANRPLIHFLQKDLHDGESETIALAIELNPDVVFLDESEARRTARVYGLNITGVIGILIRAKREGRITSLREELNRLRNEAGFFIGNDVYKKALQASGEDKY
jgi:predicted nucleic acid-binding protein